MKVGISALTLEPGRSGGIETYFRNLIKNLQMIDPEDAYSIILSPENINSIEISASNFNKLSTGEHFTERVLRKAKLSSRDSKQNLVRLIDNQSYDVVHFPLHVIYPQGIAGKKIVSVMDIQEKYWPEFFSQEDLHSRKLLHDSSIMTADHIIAISEFTKQTILDTFKIDPAKISVVYLSYNEDIFLGTSHPKPNKPLPKKYFFYPAATWPHKNHLSLIEAFAALSIEHPDFHLLMSGIKMQQDDSITDKIEKLNLMDRVHSVGYIDESHLPSYYRNAHGLVFPSLFEGFGIPLLEAMASDCPIVAANTTSIPEVAGEAAIYFDPLDPKSITKKMHQLIVDKALRKRLVSKGRDQIKLFSSQKTAEQTLEVYKKVAAL